MYDMDAYIYMRHMIRYHWCFYPFTPLSARIRKKTDNFHISKNRDKITLIHTIFSTNSTDFFLSIWKMLKTKIAKARENEMWYTPICQSNEFSYFLSHFQTNIMANASVYEWWWHEYMLAFICAWYFNKMRKCFATHWCGVCVCARGSACDVFLTHFVFLPAFAFYVRCCYYFIIDHLALHTHRKEAYRFNTHIHIFYRNWFQPVECSDRSTRGNTTFRE